MLVGGADGTPQVFRIFREKKRVIGDNYNLIRAYEKMPGRIYDLAWSPGGNTLVAVSSTGKGGFISAYKTQDAAPIWSHEFEAGLFTLSIHPSGERVICAGKDGLLRRFLVADGSLVDEHPVLPGGKKS